MNPRLLSALAFVGLTFFVLTSPASADKGGSGKGGGHSTLADASIVLNEADPHLGDSITFTASGGARISVACYQNGMVYSADQAVGTTFVLGGTASIWRSRGGSALCYAWLYQRSLSEGFVAATSFNAAGAR